MPEIIEVWDMGSNGSYMYNTYDWEGDMEEIKELFAPHTIVAWRITEVRYNKNGHIEWQGKVRKGAAIGTTTEGDE